MVDLNLMKNLKKHHDPIMTELPFNEGKLVGVCEAIHHGDESCHAHLSKDALEYIDHGDRSKMAVHKNNWTEGCVHQSMLKLFRILY